MYASLIWLAFQAGIPTIASPVWNHDYEVAMRRAEAAGKPLAVFIASGKTGWADVCADGQLSAAARRLLEKDYVCLYVDAAQPAKQHLVEAFEFERLPMLVVSDRSRVYQAYRYPGTLSDTQLVQVLQRYSQEVVPEPSDEPAYPASVPARSCRT